MRLWLTVVACGMPVAVAALIVGGVAGLAAWVGVVAHRGARVQARRPGSGHGGVIG